MHITFIHAIWIVPWQFRVLMCFSWKPRYLPKVITCHRRQGKLNRNIFLKKKKSVAKLAYKNMTDLIRPYLLIWHPLSILLKVWFSFNSTSVILVSRSPDMSYSELFQENYDYSNTTIIFTTFFSFQQSFLLSISTWLSSSRTILIFDFFGFSCNQPLAA